MKQRAQKITVSLSGETLQLADANWRKHGYRNRSAFIETAVRRVCLGPLSQGQAADIAKVYSAIERSELKDMEERLSRLHYKIAMEIAQMQIALCSLLQIDRNDCHHIRKEAYALVKETKGIAALPQVARKEYSLRLKGAQDFLEDLYWQQDENIDEGEF